MAVFGRLSRSLGVVWTQIARVLTAIFGSVQWRAPLWLNRLLASLGVAIHHLRSVMREKPRQSAGVIALSVLVVAGAFAGWRWYQAQPKPQQVDIEIVAPTRTCYECDPPGSPQALLLKFSESAAPLDAVGKPLSIHLPRLQPQHPGQWRWQDDRVLAFDPAQDWPVGQRFEIKLAKRGLIAEFLRLARTDLEFSSAAFTAEVQNAEFHQDPLVAADKKAVLRLRFSHAVDARDLEKRITLKLFDKVADDKERDLGDVAFRVSYDKLGLEADISTEALKVPDKEGRLVFEIEQGLRAARGGNPSPDMLTAEVKIPGLDSLAVKELKLDLAHDDNEDPQQVAIVEFNFPVAQQDLPTRLKAWLLPLAHPDPRIQEAFAESNPGQPYDWTQGVDNRVIDIASPLPLETIVGDRDNSELQSFRYRAAPGRYAYVRLERGLSSFGGYRLGQTQERVLRVPEYPRELRVVAPGSLLAMSGPKQLNIVSRDVPAMKVEVSRLLPRQLQHLVSQTRGDFSKPEFNGWSLNEDNLSERFSKTERLAALEPGKAAYSALDLAPYLKDEAGDRRGIFLLKLEAWDAETNRAVSTQQVNEWGNSFDAPVVDTRLIVVTDLGLLVKRNLDGSSDVFVQSIHSGEPVDSVRVEVIGRNGLPVLEQTTDAQGHTRFPALKDFVREQQPVMLLARKDGDTSFLPLDYRLRDLDLSRFDVGGIANNADRAALSAYLFSDRGVYRPGEEIRLGAIVRTQDWRALPQGLPLQLEVTDPRGQIVRREKLSLSDNGFEDIRHATKIASPTGTWTFSLMVVRDRNRRDLVGSVTVLVREFEPDRLKMRVSLSQQRESGWVAPEQLKARIDLQNLFGAPAESRRVTATLRLSPSLPKFSAYPDYSFSDPQAAREGFNEELAETRTNAQGAAEIDLRLQRFAKATYRLQLVAQGFEAQGGRGVAADVTQLVSSMPFLVGTKADGDLTYVGRNSERSAQLIAVDARLAKIEANALRLKRIESKYVSTLVRQRNGQFKYESRKRETQLLDEPLSIPATGYRLKLDSTTPGSYAYVVQDGGGQQLARIDYTVAGNANLSARLEKNAELQLALSKPDYAPGETLELQINAPYSGAGLITIERDKVYAWQWFRSDTTASTQRITLPAGIEGNAYVSVSFVRDPGSPEIYTSPHSYGVAPFSINVGARRSKVEVTLPARVKPGDTAEFRYRTDRPSKLILFAVDEGILQVARYLTPDPIAYLFQKRSLDVGTVQILDLILPEFRLAQMQAAPGGDADGLLAQHLNPFRRKSDVPVAYWSGIVDADTTERVLRYTVPDHFNGRLRVMALAVSGQAIGVFEGSSLVRGDFVLSPNVPGFVAPGDTFEVSLGVSNQAEGSGADAKLALKLSTGKGLQIVGPADPSITVAEGRESTVRFALKATRELGDVELRFSAMLGSKSATRSASVSVRPAVPYQTTLSAGSLAPGKTLEIVVPRQLYPQFREQEAGISMLPLSLARGFVAYLQHYPYACTEQLVSQAMPAVVLAQQPEFGHVQAAEGMSLAKLIDELRARQTPDGAYRNWPGGFETQDFVSVYAQHVLVEAGERGQSVPRDLLDQGNAYLRQLAARDGDTLEQDRIGAYALYLLTRQGQTLGADASRLRERLDTRYAETWRNDAAGAYLAAAMLLMKQNDEARALFDKIELKAVEDDRWYDAMTSDALWLYLASRHFPEQLADQSPALLDRIAQRINQGRTHSLSAASSLMALDAYAAQVAPQALGTLNAAAVLKDGQPQPVRLPAGLFPKFDVSGEAIKLRFQNSGGLPAFVLLSQSGFDAEPDQPPLRQGFEILREYTDAAGKTVSEVAQGEEVTVRLKFRSLSRDRYSELALIDLLPGGFERVAPAAGAQTQIGQVSLDELQDSSDEGTATGWTCAICQPGTRAQMSYADVREDRTIFYVGMGPDMSEVVYRIKATSAGTYLVPPAYGEGMYRPDLRARSSSGSITVKPR